MKGNLLKYSAVAVIIIVTLTALVWALLSANGLGIDFNQLKNGNAVDISDTSSYITQSGGIRINNDEYEDLVTASVDGIAVEMRENRIENLEPGEHTIILSLEGYNDWQSVEKVESGIIKDIYPFLFPNNPTLESKLPFVNIDKVFFSKYDDFAYYVVSESSIGADNGIWKIQLKDMSTIFNTVESEPIKILNIIPEIEEAIKNKDYTLLPSSDNKKIIFESPHSEHYIIDSENPDPNPETEILVSLEDLFGYIPESYNWFKGSSSLVIKDKNLVSEFILSNEREIIITYNPAFEPTYSVNGNSVIFFSNSDQLLYRYQDETRQVIKVENIILPTNIDSIIVDKDNGKFITFRSENKYYYLNTLESFLDEIETDIEVISLSKDGMSLLYIKDENLYSYTVKEIKIKDEFETKNNLILENYNKEIHSSKWNTRSSHILLLKKIKTEEDEPVQKLMIMDKYGENKLELINSEELKNNGRLFDTNEFFMLSNNKELVVLSADIARSNDEIRVNSLDTIKLEYQNTGAQ